MNCSRHYDRPAVGVCPDCGAGLCHECYDYTKGHLCYNCVRDYYLEQKSIVKSYTRACVSWMIVIALLAAIGIFGGVGAEELGGTGTALLVVAYAALGGFAAGGAIYVNKGSGQSLGQKLWMIVLCIALAPIFFIIRLVDFLKQRKNFKIVKETYEDYPE